MIKIEDLKVNTTYKGKTGKTFILFKPFGLNVECFYCKEGSYHFGREFIEYRNGKAVLDIEET